VDWCRAPVITWVLGELLVRKWFSLHLHGIKFFVWETPVDLSRYAAFTSEQVKAEVAAHKEEVLRKWVD